MERIITATFKMDKGDIIFRLLEEASFHTNRFIDNANNGLFKDIVFSRVIPGFMAQSGPNEPAECTHSYMHDELIPPRMYKENNKHFFGTLSGANTGQPNSDMGAFFVCFSINATRHLDAGHTTFGQVFDGWEHIEKIEQGDIINNVIINAYTLN